MFSTSEVEAAEIRAGDASRGKGSELDLFNLFIINVQSF
jgi:hypothetical protein